MKLICRDCPDHDVANHTGVRILKVDAAGTPIEWLSPRDAVCYVAQNHVLWSLGEDAVVFHGGVQRATGKQSVIATPSILAVRGAEKVKTFAHHDDILPLRRSYLFRRDRHLCAYCGNVFEESGLTVEHVIPRSRGGRDAWTNVVASCRSCNCRKDCRTPEEAHMPLLYLPYAPNRFEHFILARRKQYILGDQMEYLLAKVGGDSRLLEKNGVKRQPR